MYRYSVKWNVALVLLYIHVYSKGLEVKESSHKYFSKGS